jgi:uroporphyrinogen decarboxylase
MKSRERFFAALNGEPLKRPPVWIMRQAGRYLPEYRRLKEIHGFLKMVRTPGLAMEVTLQPLRRYPLDAAILFSDILVIPEAMGQPYAFREEGGIQMDFRIDTAEAIQRLSPNAIPERLNYMSEALKMIKNEVGKEKMVLGFVGSPWTLATYMVEGGSSKNFSRIKQLYFEHPVLFENLMERITAAVIELCKLQIKAGADAIQIFDSWGSACPGHHYARMSLTWIRRVIEALPRGYPVILFAKGMAHHFPALVQTGAKALSIDGSVALHDLRQSSPPYITLQGNIDNTLLELPPAVVEAETLRFLHSMHHARGHIVNLGHGITPQARPESVEAFVRTIVNYH